MGSKDNEGMKPASCASMFKDNTSKKTVHLSELKNDECVSGADVSIPMAFVDEYNTYAWALIEISSTSDLVKSLIVAIPFQNGLGHSLETIDIE
ncbi:hypothetical protein Tco_0417487 [Tanacetum coccineum]